jgi:hypothetical protein
MKITHIILLLFWGLASCRTPPPPTPTPTITNVLNPDFSNEFDRLFLSDETLRYQDNLAFLEAIPLEDLNSDEIDLVRIKLKAFLLLENQNRPYAPDSIHTGVASEIAFLRLYAVQVLGEIGTREDAEFIRNLTLQPEGEHPLFQEECDKAIENLNER